MTKFLSSKLATLNRVVSDLYNPSFQRAVTTDMMPAVYVLLLVGLGMLVFKLTSDAFTQHWFNGALHTVFIAPVLFLSGTVLIRVVLEFVLAVFRIAGEVEEIADLPRSGKQGLLTVRRALNPLAARPDRADEPDD